MTPPKILALNAFCGRNLNSCLMLPLIDSTKCIPYPRVCHFTSQEIVKSLEPADIIQHVGQGGFEADIRREGLFISARPLPGNDQRTACRSGTYLVQELFEIEARSCRCQMGIEISRLFQTCHKFKITQGHIRPKVKAFMTTRFEQVRNIEKSKLVVFALRQKQQDGFTCRDMCNRTLDTCNEFLPDNICNEVLLRGIDMIRNPENTDSLEKRENNMRDGFVEPPALNKSVHYRFKAFHVHVYHMLDKLIHYALLLRFCPRKRKYFLLDFGIIHFVDMRNLVPVFIQQGNVEDFLEFIIAVIADIRLRSLRFDKRIALLPNTNGMGLDAREILQVFYGKRVHKNINKLG